MKLLSSASDALYNLNQRRDHINSEYSQLFAENTVCNISFPFPDGYVLVVIQLSDEERVYLNAAALGDVPIIRQSLEENDSTLNVNCVDYMGRSGLHLAVDSESLEAIELLLDRINFECIEESLLHAISKVGY